MRWIRLFNSGIRGPVKIASPAVTARQCRAVAVVGEESFNGEGHDHT